MAKVISRMVWYFRAWRKSLPEWFGVSALGESRFPNGLVFPRMAKVISWKFDVCVSYNEGRCGDTCGVLL